MGRVFWRFFLAIWLTMAGAIGFVVLMNSFLQVLPPKEGMYEFRARFALDTVSALVRRGEVTAARSYLATIASIEHPTQLQLTPTTEPVAEIDCIKRTETFALAFDRTRGQCYTIKVLDEPLSFLETYLPPVLPPVAALLTSFISAALLARYLVRPVMTLRKGLSALASGNFGMRIGSHFGWRKDEIAALGHDFDITAGKLEELQESQKRLFHDVSHELRSPLSRMQAALGLLKKNPAKIDGVLPRMEREIERLDGLVEEILTLARLGSPRGHTIGRQTIDVIDLLSAIIEDAAFEAEPRNIRIGFEGVESFVAFVNGELIYRAIENVMRNAVKYSSEDTTISVTAEVATDRGLDITISNIGSFVPAEEVERIFDPFTRLLENETVVGHGLGLAITRRAIESHAGTVSAQSNAGGGLTVMLHLPNQS